MRRDGEKPWQWSHKTYVVLSLSSTSIVAFECEFIHSQRVVPSQFTQLLTVWHALCDYTYMASHNDTIDYTTHCEYY